MSLAWERSMFSDLADTFVKKDKNAAVTDSRKIEWLRSQIIGNCLEFSTPFGKRLMTYADHTASGRSLLFIENFILHKVLPIYGSTHTEDSFVGSRTGNIVNEAQKYVKACMGGTDEEAIFFCGSGSTAAIKRLQEVMGIAVPSILREQILGTLKKKQRWVVFVGPYEHHSNLLTWRQSLAEVVEIPLSAEGGVNLGALQAALQSDCYKHRPKLGCFSACSNVTGILTDTRTIACLLHAYGAFACFDFAACAPYVKIDMCSGQPDGFDAVVVSPHKFMGGPGTPGILMMSKKLYLLGDSAPSTCGGGTVDFVNFDEQNTVYYNDIEHREDAGTPAIIQKVRTALVYCLKEFLTPNLILYRESFFIEAAMSRLAKNPSIQIYGSTKLKRIAILSFGIYPALDLPVIDGVYSNCLESPDAQVYGSSFGFSPGRISNHNKSPLRNWVVSSPLHHLWTSSPKSSNPVRLDSMEGHKSLVGMRSIKRYFFNSRSPHRKQYTEMNSNTEETGQARGKPLHGRFIVTLLNDLFGIQARGGCSCAAPYGHRLLGVDTTQSLELRGGIKKGYASVKPGWARISFGYYLSNEEFEFILSAIEFIAEFGTRFLPLYDLNWKTGDWTFKKQYQSIRDLGADEQAASSDMKQSMWFNDSSSGFAFKAFSNVAPLMTKNYNATLTSYLKMARYFAVVDYLGWETEETSRREIPSDLDPSLITFRI